jgi:hypothetical protein
MNHLNKLLSIASDQLCDNTTNHLTYDSNSLLEQLNIVLKEKNGFYVFESALHVFPSISSDNQIGIIEWNETSLWKTYYNCDLSNVTFFAEDIFGNQFCIKDKTICLFDVESMSFEYLATSMEEWAELIIYNYDMLTGFKVANEWQQLNGVLPTKQRLLPKIPFILGGEYSLNNLYTSDAIEGMRFRASIANQIKDLPDGVPIKISIN